VLVEYVVYLSLRGEVERAVAGLVLDEGEYLPLGDYLVEEEAISPVARRWKEADSLVVDPGQWPSSVESDTLEDRAASIERGWMLYSSSRSPCIQCHGPTGRGNGEQNELYDDWNKPKKGVSSAQTRHLAKRFSLPLQRLTARNFHEGIFRGGGRPIDIYRRIHVGIKGTPMPGSGPNSATEGVFRTEEIRDVVQFILSLSGK